MISAQVLKTLAELETWILHAFASTWIVDAHRDDGQRFVVHADEKVTAYLELERAICLRLLTDQILEK